MALVFLKTIRDHQISGGVTGEDLQRVLSVKHPKGVGSRLALINHYLIQHGFDTAQLYQKHRGADGVRHWNAGPGLTSAIDALELV